MKYWILIPSYLWKNTYKRWIENLISPITKIVATFLLTLLSLFILGYFIQSELELDNRLMQSDVFSVKLTESVSPNNSIQKIFDLHEEETLWKRLYGAQNITSYFQILGSAKAPDGQKIPVIIFKDAIPQLSIYKNNQPIIWIMTDKPHYMEKTSSFSILDHQIFAKPTKILPLFQEKFKLDTVIAIPFEVAIPFLSNGGVNHSFAHFSSKAEVESFVKTSQAYYKAENRNVFYISSIKLLKQLAQLNNIQGKVRTILIIFCGSLLSLINGSLAWLEFRQEIYLISLLRSFGVSKYLIIAHAFLENLLLIAIALFIAISSWKYLYSNLTKHIPLLSSSNSINLHQDDLNTILTFALLGATLSTLPILIGIRKQPGLVLQ